MSPITFDYNQWSLFGAGNVLFNSNGSSSTNGREVHGLIDLDPQFTNQAGANFTPATGSRLINAGANLFSVGVVWDFNKNPRPSSGPFTMGAFQPTARFWKRSAGKESRRRPSAR